MLSSSIRRNNFCIMSTYFCYTVRQIDRDGQMLLDAVFLTNTMSKIDVRKCQCLKNMYLSVYTIFCSFPIQKRTRSLLRNVNIISELLMTANTKEFHIYLLLHLIISLEDGL